MEICDLVSDLPRKKAAIYTIENGACVQRTYARMHDDINEVCARLRAWNVGAGTRVGIYAPNSYQWLVHDLALIVIGAISVPFTDDFRGSVNEALIERYNLSLLLISRSHAGLFVNKPDCVAFLDFENGKVQLIHRDVPVDEDRDDQLTHVFSSGSAGGMKGLIISKKGVMATLPPVLDTAGFASGDRLLLFLPMANFQQRYLSYGAIWYDFDIILTDYTELFPAMECFHPTILVAPPVLYQMIHADFFRGGVLGHMRQLCIGALSLLPLRAMRRTVARKAFSKFYRQFGNNMRLLITGMAPIPQGVGRFFQKMQLPLCEAYGMVEVGVMAYRPPGAHNIASVGRALYDVEFCFEDDGEIIVKRAHPVALRYFECADGENERTFVGPGRIATGDMGKLQRDGSLLLLGRKKALIVLPNGQKIHPEAIETALNNFPDVGNSVVFRKKGTAHLRCVIALNEPGNEKAETRAREFVAAFRERNKTIPFLETVFADAPFSKENGMLRPNMKIDRNSVAAKYES